MAFLLSVVILTEVSYSPLFAKTTSEKLKEAQEEKQATEGKLSETKGKIGSLTESKTELQGYLGDLNDNLQSVSDKLSEIEKKQADKQNEIVKTTEELNQAIADMNEQYDFMKKRIRFVYEQGENSYVDLFLNAKDFGEFLNHAEYVSKMNEYDTKMLQKMRELKEETASRKKQLEKEKEELASLQEDAKTEQNKVKGMVTDTTANIAGFSNQISSAENDALVYEATIKQKEGDIAQLQKELEKERELARKSRTMTKKDLSQINIADGDKDLLACLIYCEAGGEPYEGQLAVGSVVMNRCMSGAFPDTIVGVIYQSGQFAPVASGRLAARIPLGANDSCYRAAEEAISGVNNIGDCLFFRTIIPEINGTIIGNHVFYNLY